MGSERTNQMSVEREYVDVKSGGTDLDACGSFPLRLVHTSAGDVQDGADQGDDQENGAQAQTRRGARPRSPTAITTTAATNRFGSNAEMPETVVRRIFVCLHIKLPGVLPAFNEQMCLAGHASDMVITVGKLCHDSFPSVPGVLEDPGRLVIGPGSHAVAFIGFVVGLADSSRIIWAFDGVAAQGHDVEEISIITGIRCHEHTYTRGGYSTTEKKKTSKEMDKGEISICKQNCRGTQAELTSCERFQIVGPATDHRLVTSLSCNGVGEGQTDPGNRHSQQKELGDGHRSEVRITRWW